MGLETGTFIDSLNASNPVHATDQVSQADDHLRLIKSTILSTFPNITGAVNVTQTVLNYLAGVTGTTGTGNIALSASPTFTGTVTAGSFSGAINAANVTSGTLPNARIAQAGVTQHQAALSVTESQISDLGDYLSAGDVASSLSIGNADTTLTRKSAQQLAVENRAVFTHQSSTFVSAQIHFLDGVEPVDADGSDGDIFLVY